MKTLSITLFSKSWQQLLINIVAILAIYFTPAISHNLGVPIYLFEPMRIFVILALLHTNKFNAYMLAIGLPIFSFMISSHPVVLKAILISLELVLNVGLYYLLVKKNLQQHWAVVVSVLSSKLVYYLLKYLLISTALINSTLISTPLYIQLFTTLVFGVYAYLWIKRLNKN